VQRPGRPEPVFPSLALPGPGRAHSHPRRELQGPPLAGADQPVDRQAGDEDSDPGCLLAAALIGLARRHGPVRNLCTSELPEGSGASSPTEADGRWRAPEDLSSGAPASPLRHGVANLPAQVTTFFGREFEIADLPWGDLGPRAEREPGVAHGFHHVGRARVGRAADGGNLLIEEGVPWL